MIESSSSLLTESKIMMYLDQFLPILREEILKMKTNVSQKEYALELEKSIQNYPIMYLTGKMFYLIRHYICYCYRPYFPNNNFLFYKVFCQMDVDFIKIFTINDPNYTFFRGYFERWLDTYQRKFEVMEQKE